MTELLYLALGWVPLWIAVVATGQKLRPSRLLLGAAICGVAGGIAASELRLRGLQAAPAGSLLLPILGFPLEEVLRYGLLGAAGALGGDFLLDRLDRKSGTMVGARTDRRPPP